MKLNLTICALFVCISASSQWMQPDTAKQKTTQKKNWFEVIQLRGYVQLRYNRLFETNEKLKCDQCDRSWGEGGGFFLRRMRMIFFGNITPRIFFYFQPDFASSASGSNLHFSQIRDMYIDLGIDKKNEFRLRIGQSKVPFGFENMQSSQNRLPLDRNDALNSAVLNERDIGMFFYWAPKKVRERFSDLVNSGYKGSGDYGVFALGIYNGQTANKPEMNKIPHVVARVSYPFQIGKQVIEPGFQAYTGKFVIPKESITAKVKHLEDRDYIDRRIAGTFVLYPKPFGIQAEYNYGMGPEYDKVTDSIVTRALHGGYATLSYMANIKGHILFPFVRGQYYRGGKKFETDARSYEVKELEIGIEWQPVRQFEFVCMYTISSRRFEDGALRNNLQSGRLLRLQAQLNF